MSEDTIQQLEQLIGKTKVYLGKKIVIKSYKEITGSVIVIKTDGLTYSFLPHEMEEFFKELKEVPKNLPEVKSKKTEITINGYQPTAENITLKESLINVLKEINNNASDETIKKASSICAVANTMVNIQKAEIYLINTLKK
ncbi:MAG: hypothetical protein KGZ87_05470 [Bacteroidetes bacterium]|nr:hypothetical protein [Bacteroidota bacterium]